MRPLLLALALLAIGCGTTNSGTAGVNPPLGTTVSTSPASSPPFFTSPFPTPTPSR